MIKNLRNKKKKGFTLVELIIVIAIIAILVAIAVPQFGKIREKANVSADLANAKSIYSAVAACVADEDVPSTFGTAGTVAGQKDLNAITTAKTGADTTDIKAVEDYLGGSNNLPTPKAYQKSKFQFVVSDGEIRIFVSNTTDASLAGESVKTLEIYPNAAGSKYPKSK